MAGYYGYGKLKWSCNLIALSWFAIVYVSPIPQVVIYNLESRNPIIDLKSISSASNARILVLGGGHDIAPELPAGSQLTTSALARLCEGIRIQRIAHGSKLVCSGYSSSGRTTQAEMLALAALELGISPFDTLMIKSPSNTMEEAKAYQHRFGTSDTVILVTSAAHMVRAIECFGYCGIPVIPAPADFQIRPDPIKGKYSFRPSLEKLRLTSIALHEYGGMVGLKLGYW